MNKYIFLLSILCVSCIVSTKIHQNNTKINTFTNNLDLKLLNNSNKPNTIILLGDSILDNSNYSMLSVSQSIKKLNSHIMLLNYAQDGSMINNLSQQ